MLKNTCSIDALSIEVNWEFSSTNCQILILDDVGNDIEVQNKCRITALATGLALVIASRIAD